MDEWEWVFFFNEDQNNVESVTTYHQLECDIGSLAEAHPEVIYFYAEFRPLLEWDFNEVAMQPTLFDVDEPKLIVAGTMRNLSLDAEPNAFGYGIDHATFYIKTEAGEEELRTSDLWEKQNDAFRGDGSSRPPTPDE